jgi:hypothetical protein
VTHEQVAAGYFGVVPGSPPSWIDARYSGDEHLSIDRELVAMVPGPSWATSSMEKSLVQVGVPHDAVAAASSWLDDPARGTEILYPNVYRRPSLLNEFLARFAPASPVRLLGVALADDELDGFTAAYQQKINQASGVIAMLEMGEALEPGYQELGYEPVEVTWGGFGSSWTIHGLQPDVERATGVAPNHVGFISTRDEARRVMDYLEQPVVGKEPGVWRAWLIVAYPRRIP